jgi:diguanylate cyclase (GGDEF)-like protein/PAS domain S-box-containing protein
MRRRSQRIGNLGPLDPSLDGLAGVSMGHLMLLSSIRARLLGLVLAAVIPLAALIACGLWGQWQSERASALQRATHEARLLAAQVDDHITYLDSLLTGLSKAVSTDPADTAANDAFLRKVKSELPGYIANVFLFSLDGTNIGSSADPKRERPNGRGMPCFEGVLAGQSLAVGDPLLARSGRWVVNVARPVTDETGQMRAVLAVGPVLDNFQDSLKRFVLPEGSIITIVSDKGIVIASSHPSQSWIGSKVNWTHLAQRIARREGSDIARWYQSDGAERVTGFSTAHRVPWLVQIGIRTDVAFAALTRHLEWSAGIIFGTLVLAFAIGWLLSGRIVRPLRQLGKDAAVLAAGDLSHRTEVRSGDEVGALADNFNQMAEALEVRRQKARNARGELRQAKDTLATVIDTSQVAIVCSDMHRSIVLWSRGAEQMFGYTAEEVMGQPTKLVPGETAAESQALFERAYRGETIRDMYVKRRRKDGALLDVRLAAAPMHNADGSVRNVAFAYEDITERRMAEEQLRKLAHYDQLTGLPNRVSLQQELERQLAQNRGRPTSIALFDLDEFKDVNDTLGHSTGDGLLLEVGQRLIAVAEEHSEVGLVSRLGGDEFVVIIPDCGDPRVVGEIADLIIKRLTEPFIINDQLVLLGASAGIAIAPQDGASVDELIANADLALYQAKSDGGRVARFFMPVLRAQAQARRSLGLELRRAFAQDELEIYFQPQVRLADNAVVGAEALLRWRHPLRGVLAPGAFIDMLAESSIASEVGRWIIRSACEKAAAWRAMGLPLVQIGVNLFPNQAFGETLLPDVAEALRDFGLPADALELEITENIALRREDSTVLQKLRDMGVKLAFDDFGTGYASLSSLTRFPLSRIKIDRSFVGKITEDAQDAAIVRSLIAMAHNLDLAVIAEGVETVAQAAFLLNERCEEAQGYLYAKPLPAAEFEAYLRSRRLALRASTELDQRRAELVDAERQAAKPSRRRKSL